MDGLKLSFIVDAESNRFETVKDHYRSNALRWNASEDAPASSFQIVFYDV